MMVSANGVFDPNIFDPNIFDTGDPATVESYDWTGIESRLAANPEIVAEIAKKITELDALVDSSGITNSEKARAKAITIALLSLVDSLQPEWRAIVELLNSPIITAICNAAAIGGLAFGAVRLITG